MYGGRVDDDSSPILYEDVNHKWYDKMANFKYYYTSKANQNYLFTTQIPRVPVVVP